MAGRGLLAHPVRERADRDHGAVAPHQQQPAVRFHTATGLR